MPGYGVGLSVDVEKELCRQPLDVQGEFRAVCDKLQDLAMARTIERSQLTLPGFTDHPDRIETYPFGFNGAVHYQFVGEGQVEIVDMRWPTEVDDGTPAGQPARDRS